MSLWLWAALAMLLALVPCAILSFRGPLTDRLVGLQATAVVVTLELILLVEGVQRTPMHDLGLTMALLTFGGGLVFTRFVERWL